MSEKLVTFIIFVSFIVLLNVFTVRLFLRSILKLHFYLKHVSLCNSSDKILIFGGEAIMQMCNFIKIFLNAALRLVEY